MEGAVSLTFIPDVQNTVVTGWTAGRMPLTQIRDGLSKCVADGDHPCPNGFDIIESLFVPSESHGDCIQLFQLGLQALNLPCKLWTSIQLSDALIELRQG